MEKKLVKKKSFYEYLFRQGKEDPISQKFL